MKPSPLWNAALRSRPPVGQSRAGVGRAVVMKDGRVRLDVRAARAQFLALQHPRSTVLAMHWRVQCLKRITVAMRAEAQAAREEQKRQTGLADLAELLMAYEKTSGPLELSVESRYVLCTKVEEGVYEESDAASLGKILRAWSSAARRGTEAVTILPVERSRARG